MLATNHKSTIEASYNAEFMEAIEGIARLEEGPKKLRNNIKGMSCKETGKATYNTTYTVTRIYSQTNN